MKPPYAVEATRQGRGRTTGRRRPPIGPDASGENLTVDIHRLGLESTRTSQWCVSRLRALLHSTGRTRLTSPIFSPLCAAVGGRSLGRDSLTAVVLDSVKLAAAVAARSGIFPRASQTCEGISGVLPRRCRSLAMNSRNAGSKPAARFEPVQKRSKVSGPPLGPNRLAGLMEAAEPRSAVT
jgi:hypothetical protein